MPYVAPTAPTKKPPRISCCGGWAAIDGRSSIGWVWCQYRSQTVATATITIPAEAATRHRSTAPTVSHIQAPQTASNTSGGWAPLDIIERITLAISPAVWAAIISANGPKATTATSTRPAREEGGKRSRAEVGVCR